MMEYTLVFTEAEIRQLEDVVDQLVYSVGGQYEDGMPLVLLKIQEERRKQDNKRKETNEQE